MSTGANIPAGRNRRSLLTSADKLDIGITLLELAGSFTPNGRPIRAVVSLLYWWLGGWLVREVYGEVTPEQEGRVQRELFLTS